MSESLRWFKSSYSDDSGGSCVEVAIDQRTSSHTIHLRDSKSTDGPTFAVAPIAWSTFLDWAK
ncbi:DUF397 domain-containing protein [Streptomyces sp. NPDC091376]|uniref:DUF397 domain-containing protein n=1 Tax=Streptomyces sp. NPDC091376 TaxID=3365994 RepID=UPI00382C6A9A